MKLVIKTTKTTNSKSKLISETKPQNNKFKDEAKVID